MRRFDCAIARSVLRWSAIASASCSVSPTNGCCCTPTRSPLGSAFTGELNPGAMFGTGGSANGTGGAGWPVVCTPVPAPLRPGPGLPPLAGPGAGCCCAPGVVCGVGGCCDCGNVVGCDIGVDWDAGVACGCGGIVCASAMPLDAADAVKMLALSASASERRRCIALLDRDRGFDRHPDAQRLVFGQVARRDAHRQALRHLHEV